jgi:glycosyltransferase involved in cell wall biosynthesis
VVSTSVADLADALSSLLANRARLKEMGENGYHLVKKQYHWDQIVESLISVYAEGISPRMGVSHATVERDFARAWLR